MYLFLKWLHLVSAISWIAGILYLVRMLVLLADAGHKPDARDVLLTSGLRAYKFVTLPPMVLTFVGGLGMIFINPGILAGWLYAKLALLLVLAGGSGFAGARIKRYAKGEHALPSGLALRLLNELPALLMLVVVALAVFRPF